LESAVTGAVSILIGGFQMTISSSAQLVSASAAGVAGNNQSGTLGYTTTAHFLPGDTRVIFISYASNLVAGDTNDLSDIFIKDLSTGAITRLSTASGNARYTNGASSLVGLTSDLGGMLFDGVATLTIANQTIRVSALFYKNLNTGTVVQVDASASGQANGFDHDQAFILADSVRVLFESESNVLTTGDTNNVMDIFIKNTTTGVVSSISSNSAGVFGNARSWLIGGGVSNATADGTQFFFMSNASNLVSGDTNASPDVFMKNITTGVTIAISSSSTGVISNGESYFDGLSASGTKAWFESDGSNLVAGDTNQAQDIFIKNIQTGVTTLVSSNASGIAGNSTSYFIQASADENKVLMASFASNLVSGDTNGDDDIFVKNLTTGAVTVVNSRSDGTLSGYSDDFVNYANADLSKILFSSNASNLVTGDTNGSNDLFLKNMNTGVLTLVSANAAGVVSNGYSYFVSLSDDETKVLFEGMATNLVAGDSGNHALYLKDLVTGAITKLIESSDPNGGYTATFVDGGSKVLFEYETNNAQARNSALSSGNGVYAFEQVFVYDLASGVTTQIAGGESGVSGGTRYIQSYDVMFAPFENIILGSVSANGSKFILNSDTTIYSDSGSGSVGGISAYVDGNSYVLPVTAAGISAPKSGDSGANQLIGGDGADDISGMGGNDTLIGGFGRDWLKGNDGNDTLFGEAGDDALIGGEGDDTLFGQEGNDSLFGSRGNDTIIGGLGADLLVGEAGNDTLSAEDGDDRLYGGRGIDRLIAGFGDDSLYGEDDDDTLFGEGGNDTLVGGFGDDVLYGQVGADTLFGEAGNDSLSGGMDNDLVYGQAGNDFLLGDEGNDSLYGGVGADRLLGGSGDDSLYGEDDNDTLFGEAGNDTLGGGNGADLLYGQDGNDNLTGDAGNDTLVGGYGLDRLIGGIGDDTLYGEDDNDTLFGETGNDTLIGGFGDDSLYGQDGVDTLFGEAGNDTLLGGTGGDTLFGQAGIDVINGEDGDDALYGGADSDTLRGGLGNDAVAGEDGADTLYGDDGNDTVIGGDGNDFVLGGNGSDQLMGGNGNDYLYADNGNNDFDQLWGGAGADTFFLALKTNTADNIYDFNRLEGDRFIFSAAAVGAPVGFQLTQGLGFQQGAGVMPTAATASFYFDTSTKALWYDADGTGAASAQVIAFLINTPTLAAGDFYFT
jgi:hypothetical protein